MDLWPSRESKTIWAWGLMKLISWMWFLVFYANFYLVISQKILLFPIEDQARQLRCINSLLKKKKLFLLLYIVVYKEQHGYLFFRGFKKSCFYVSIQRYICISLANSSNVFQTGIKFSWMLHILSIWVCTNVQGQGLYFIYLCTPRY